MLKKVVVGILNSYYWKIFCIKLSLKLLCKNILFCFLLVCECVFCNKDEMKIFYLVFNIICDELFKEKNLNLGKFLLNFG